VIVCANGADHRDYGVGKVSRAAYEQAARDAADFMDAERDNSPWECGPHTVRTGMHHFVCENCGEPALCGSDPACPARHLCGGPGCETAPARTPSPVIENDQYEAQP
jgi:hypothetical protein